MFWIDQPPLLLESDREFSWPLYQCQHQWIELYRYKTVAGSSTDPADYSWDKLPAMVREQCAFCWTQRERME